MHVDYRAQFCEQASAGGNAARRGHGDESSRRGRVAGGGEGSRATVARGGGGGGEPGSAGRWVTEAGAKVGPSRHAGFGQCLCCMSAPCLSGWSGAVGRSGVGWPLRGVRRVQVFVCADGRRLSGSAAYRAAKGAKGGARGGAAGGRKRRRRRK